MPSSALWARAATGLVAALLTATPTVSHASADPVAETSTDETSAAAFDPVDPASATAAEVAADLQRLDQEVAAARVAVANEHAALMDAEATLEASESRARAAEAAAEIRRAERARVVDPPANDVVRLLSADRPDALPQSDDETGSAADLAEVALADARDAVAAAEHASDEAVADRNAAEDDLDAFVGATVARTTTRLAEADQRGVTDPATADVIRAEESTVHASLATALANQQARAAEDAAVATGTDTSAAPAPVTPAPAPEPAPTTPAPAPVPEPAPLPDPAGSASGALAGAWCADGTRIVVDASLGLSVQYLINDAAAAGVGLCGSGFRTYQEQVELRRAHCGSSDAAVYDAPPSSCSPPTARPGTSNHEDGLAVDFSCADGQPMTHASPCYQWLARNAVNYGLVNLPSEPWHWSVTGR